MTIVNKNIPITVYRMSTINHECPWGLRAIELLNRQGMSFEDIKLTSQEEINAFKLQHHVATTPQIFFGEKRIGGYTDLAKYLEVEPEKTDFSYTPVIALFSTTALMSIATSTGMPGFMGFSLSLLASLKLMDLNGFVESFSKYDLVTQKIKPYGKVYPFAELITGLGYLSGAIPLATGISSLIIGVTGAISVFKAVYIDKIALNCACIGGNSKAPLGIVSFTENAIMALMGAFLITSSQGIALSKLSHINQIIMSEIEIQSQKLLDSPTKD